MQLAALERFSDLCVSDEQCLNTGIFHVFEMRIGMIELDHRIFALLEQQREKPKTFVYYHHLSLHLRDYNDIITCSRLA